jgi:PleD family two-component response regulator
VTIFDPNHPIGITDLIQSSDKKMYAGKHDGRDQVIF